MGNNHLIKRRTCLKGIGATLALPHRAEASEVEQDAWIAL